MTETSTGQDAAGLQRGRQQRQRGAGRRPSRPPSTVPRPDQLPQRPLRAVPVRLHRRGRRPGCRRRATRSRCRASRTTRAASPAATRRSTSARSSTSSPTSGSATASRSRPGTTSGSTRAGRTGASGTGSSARHGGAGPGRYLRRPLRDHARRGLGDRPGDPGRRPRQPVRVLPHLPARRDDACRATARSSGDHRVLRARAGAARGRMPTATSAPRSSSPRPRRRAASRAPKLDLLDQYFQQWLYGETKPTILPGDFS